MAFTWHGTARTEAVVNLGPLALIQPLLDQLDIAGIIDRHLPPDPQLEYSHGQVLSLLLAARLCQPTALINLPAWAERTGADILWNLPADKLNDDRLGRALDAFFEHRHSVFASTTALALDPDQAEKAGESLRVELESLQEMRITLRSSAFGWVLKS